MKSNRILAVVVTSISGDFLSCFHASTVTGIVGGIWVAGQGHDYVNACFLVDGFRSKMYSIPTSRGEESDNEVARFISDAESEGWQPFLRPPREKAVYAPQLRARS